MSTNNRPISPHLQVYKLPLTGILSITHRFTGALLSVGLIFVVYILYALAGGSNTYAAMQSFTSTGLVRLLYWGFIYALFFHLCHGVRHLIWDAGKSFDRDTLNRYAIIELAASLFLTLTTLIILSI
jgi:succinate dehydrogenase / fumarate reductase, cytochrome b subunit